MFSFKESIKYGWERMKENFQLTFFATLLLVAVGAMTGGRVLGFLAMIFLLILRIGYLKIFLRMYDNEKPKFSDLFSEYPLFWKYLGVSILYPLVVSGGLILLIIPGIIWAVRFSFSPIILVDTKMGPITSMKESYAITSGKFWNLFGFFLVIGLFNILGLLVLGVGLLITIPVSMFAVIQVYRKLTAEKSALVA